MGDRSEDQARQSPPPRPLRAAEGLRERICCKPTAIKSNWTARFRATCRSSALWLQPATRSACAKPWRSTATSFLASLPEKAFADWLVAAAMQASNGMPEEAVELADRALRLDPCMTPENLGCIKDAYFYARRFGDFIAVVSRTPQDARGLGSRLLLTLSYALLGRREERARARAELLAAYPSISAELLLNQGWSVARPEEEAVFLDGFRAAGLAVCASDADLAQIVDPRRLAECVKN
jgi:hypothetical protein